MFDCAWSIPKMCDNDAMNTWKMLGVEVHLCDTHDWSMYQSWLLHGAIEPVSSISVIVHGGK